MNNLFNSLGLSEDNGLYITDQNKWYGLFPKRIEEFFENKNAPDAFFCIDNKPFILFYANIHNKNDIFRSVWNFNESPVVFIIEPDSIEIYNGYKYLKETLSKIDGNYKDDFHYLKLVTGETWSKYQDEFDYKNRVDTKLLENIKSARNYLVDRLEISKSLANRLIGKCIFTRYLIDRKVRLGYSNKSEYFSNNDFAKILEDKNETKEFFTYLQEKFNGDLFYIDEAEYQFNENVLIILRHLILGSSIQDSYIQYSLFDIYDFSIIPVEFISNVYELFIGENNQADNGAYYTPVFLVDYILSQTVEKYFKDHPDRFNCKILDPACGSGVFLVEAYRKIIKQYEKNNPSVKKDKKKYKDALIRLAENNIFGIDKDSDAVSVAAFSIYLTMLHYQSPPDIENFKFPRLTETNFFKGDFFDSEFDRNERLKKIDFIIGNPPWKRGKGKELNPLYLQYIERRKKKENSKIEISNREIAQAFLLRVSDFSDLNTQCALIVTSKVLYNLQGIDFRKYLLDNYFIEKIFEFAPVRREVFNNSNDPSIAPASIIFYRYAHSENTDDNILEHIALKPNRFFKMFKVFSIQRNDFKRVIQKRLKEYDYLWKVLVYGSYLDFNFIKRLKDDYNNFSNIINDKTLLVGEGVIIGNNGKYDATEYQNKLFIDPKKNIINNFFIELDYNNLFKVDRVHRKRNPELFKPPILLISRSINNRLIPKSVVLNKEAIFTHAFTGVKAKNNDVTNLKILNGILASILNSYFILQTGTSSCIEREQIHDSEKWNIPFIDNKKIAFIVEKIEKYKLSYFEETKIALSPKIDELKEKINNAISELDEEVLKSFKLTEEENALVDYAITNTIPLIMKHDGYEGMVFSPIKSSDGMLIEYVKIFFDRFDETFNKIGLRLSVEICINNNIIAMFFTETPKTDKIEDRIKYIKDVSFDNIISRLSSLGVNKISDKLFIQKDIRGFENNGFYIIKPNEKRLWHKAIAYLDMYEFAAAILKAGMEEVDVL